MKDYPLKPRKRGGKKKKQQYFDKSKLTDAHKKLLDDFYERRNQFDLLIKESNIIYDKRTCPACGYPTLDKGANYQTCVLCLWEDHGIDNKQDTLITAPNYISLLEERVNISNFLFLFRQHYFIEESLDLIIKGIQSFEEKLSAGQIEIDRDSFETNIKNILPTQSK